MLNNVSLMGRIAADLEPKTLQNDMKVLSFPIAVEKNYTNADGKRDFNFFQIVAWRGTAEFISKFFKKGDMIVVTGELSTRDWTDKDGRKHRETEVVVNSAYFTGARSSAEKEQRATPKPPAEVSKSSKDDLPFYQSENDSDPWA